MGPDTWVDYICIFSCGQWETQLSIASFLWGPGYLVSTGKTTLPTVTSGEAVLVSLSGIEAVVVPRIL